MLVLNGEIRFPIVGWLRGATFVDVGGTSLGLRGLNPRGLATGAGAGLRLRTPFAIFRVDLGYPLTNRRGASGPRWHFSIGEMF
jgi:outer membrane translocation and assembly module TamA